MSWTHGWSRRCKTIAGKDCITHAIPQTSEEDGHESFPGSCKLLQTLCTRIHFGVSTTERGNSETGPRQNRVWTTERLAAFQQLKISLTKGSVLVSPDEKPFLLYMDASGAGIGAILGQAGVDGTD